MPKLHHSRGTSLCLRPIGLLLTFLLAFVVNAGAATFVVNTTVDTQDVAPGNAVCADGGGMCSLRAAITEANALAGADVITLPAGTYTHALVSAEENANAGGDFDITSPLTINGAGAATTIIQAHATSASSATERVFHVLNGGTAVTIDGVTIQNGNSLIVGAEVGRGGGIRAGNNAAGDTAINLTLTNSTIRNNLAGTRGGGLAINKGNLIVTNCTFDGNMAGNLMQSVAAQSGGAGGAVLIDSQDNVAVVGQTSTLTNTVMSNNTATSNFNNTFGGALIVRAVDSLVTLTGCTINNNNSTATSPPTCPATGVASPCQGFAGGLYNQNAHMIVMNSTVSGNSSSHFHPGIRNVASIVAATLDIINSTVSNNTSSEPSAWGGGITNIGGSFDATLNIDNSTISGNSLTGSTSFGGGLVNTGNGSGAALMNITNSTISGNSAHDVAGVYSDGTSATCIIDFSTISENTADAASGEGGGVYQDATAGGATFISNSISANNVAFLSADINNRPTSLNYNHIETPNTFFITAANDVTGSDPLLGPLANNGGPTLTRLPGVIVRNTIPNGTNGCGGPITNDQRGTLRPAGGGCDKGSVEFDGPIPTSTLTATASPSATNTSTVTPTPMGTATQTNTPTRTATNTPTPTGSPCLPGNLDTSLNGTGKVTTAIGSGPDSARSVAIQSDGKMVAAGSSFNGANYDFALVRYNADGTLDTAFNGTGNVTTPIGSSQDEGTAVAIQSDGKIVVGGSVTVASVRRFGLARYNTNGTLDTSFNGTGKVTTQIGTEAILYSIAIQYDGKIVAAGNSYNGVNTIFALARYNADGTLDTSFNGTGTLTTSFFSPRAEAFSVAIQSDQRIVAAGTSGNGGTYDIAIARYNPDGSLDPSFNGGGKVLTQVGIEDDLARAVAIQSDGRIVVAGNTARSLSADPSYFALVRYNVDGTLDTSFNGTGKVTTLVGVSSVAYAIAIQSDGRIVAAGNSYNGSNADFGLARYNVDGSLDTSFKGTGKVITPIGTSGDYAWAVAMQVDRIVVAGSVDLAANSHFGLVRYYGGQTCGPVPTTTPTSTPTITPTFTPTNTATLTPTATASPTPPGPPALGNYTNTSIYLSTNSTIAPDTTPLNVTSVNVATSSNFKGKFEGDPATGVVRVTDAHPAGTYTVNVTAFGPGGSPSTKTFTLTVMTAIACSPLSFSGGFTYPVNALSPSSVAIGDLNRDGRQDILTANWNSNDVSVLLGDGSGGFGTPTNFPIGLRPISIAVGDFNGDGNQDIVSANSGSVTVSILLGNGAGGFGPPTEIIVNTGSVPSFVTVGEFNSDGRQDLAVSGVAAGGTLSILLGNGAGGFSVLAGYSTFADANLNALGDLNNDGKTDIMTVGQLTGYLWLGNGAGGFSLSGTFSTGSTTYRGALGDLNGDGNQDVVFSPTNFSVHSVSVGLGDGAGHVGAAPNFAVGTEPFGVATGDFNSDGSQDLAVANRNSNNVSILLGTGTGAFNPRVNFGVGTQPYDVAIGDFNGDGRQDFVSANRTGNSVTVFLRQCAPTPSPTITATFTPTNTATPTNTSTATATATFTPTPLPEISGVVTYANAIGGPVPVLDVNVIGAGSPDVFAATDGDGAYTLAGFGAGPYAVTPSKENFIRSGITSFDAARIAQHVSSLNFLNANQAVAADVSGNGIIQSFDASLIVRYVLFLPGSSGLTGTWVFSPSSRTYPSVSGVLTGEDYSAFLMGDVSGDWTENGARAAVGPERPIAVELPSMETSVDKEIVVPVNVQGAVGKDVISYEFDLRYDPSVIQPIAEPADLNKTVSRGLWVVTNATEPGLLRVVVYGAMPIDEDGVLLNLRFAAVGSAGSGSPLTFERIMFNEDLSPTILNGQIELF